MTKKSSMDRVPEYPEELLEFFAPAEGLAGTIRAKALTPEERSASARKASKTRWEEDCTYRTIEALEKRIRFVVLCKGE